MYYELSTVPSFLPKYPSTETNGNQCHMYIPLRLQSFVKQKLWKDHASPTITWHESVRISKSAPSNHNMPINCLTPHLVISSGKHSTNIARVRAPVVSRISKRNNRLYLDRCSIWKWPRGCTMNCARIKSRPSSGQRCAASPSLVQAIKPLRFGALQFDREQIAIHDDAIGHTAPCLGRQIRRILEHHANTDSRTTLTTVA